MHWSMDPVPGALAGFFPGKPVRPDAASSYPSP